MHQQKPDSNNLQSANFLKSSITVLLHELEAHIGGHCLELYMVRVSGDICSDILPVKVHLLEGGGHSGQGVKVLGV